MNRSNEPSEDVNGAAHAVSGAAVEVHKLLGPGFLESVYEEALSMELQLRGISFARQAPVSVSYKGRIVGDGKIDLLVEDILVVELKAVEALAPIHSVQLLSYLKSTGHKLGLLINFNVPVLRDGIKRVLAPR